MKATKTKAAEDAANATEETPDTSVLDDLLEKLRSGDAVAGRRLRRQRPGATARTPGPLLLDGDGEPAVKAMDMLQQLQSGGFVVDQAYKEPLSPRFQVKKRRPRIRPDSSMDGEQILEWTGEGDDGSSVGAFSPTPSTTFEMSEDVPEEEQPPDRSE